MKKYNVIFSILSLAVLMFTGCENFLSGSNVQAEIQDMLAYQYADAIDVRLDLINGEGTAKTNTSFKKKPTDKFTLSFQTDEKYAFLGWEIELTTKDKESVPVSVAAVALISGSGVSEYFESIETSVVKNYEGSRTDLCTISGKISKEAELSRIILKPVLQKRPEIEKISVSPKYEPTFVSRESPIRVPFSQEISPECFYFTPEELERAQVYIWQKGDSYTYDSEKYEILKYNEDGTDYIYGYKDKSDGFIYYKNITIVSDSISVASCFKRPVLVVYEHENGINTSELLLEADPDNCLEIGNSGFRSITVTLPDNIYNTEGVTLLEGYTWSYQVSAAALERAAIRFTCNAEEGVLEETLLRSENDPAVKYNVGQQITLKFEANSEYQFIRWDFDTRYVAIQNYWKPSAVARVVAKTPDSGSDSETLITAVCAKRPTFAVTTERPRNGNDSVPRDSSIYLTFSENIPRGINGEREPGSPSDAGLKQVDYDSQIKNIRISMNGDPVNSCFLDPVQNNSIIGSSIIFKADPENRMTVPSGQTKTVTICVPSDFYYVYKYKDEDYHVTLGADIYETYKVNHDTLDMTGVTFLTLSDTHGGTIEPSGAHEYAMGDVIPVTYEPAAGYQFDNWSVTINGIPVAEDSDEIKLLPRNSPNATLEILKKVTSQVDITANVSQILSVDSIMLTGSKHGTKEDPAYKDSTITVNFNRPIDPSCKKSDIVIACDSIPCTNSFADITISGTQLIIRNTKRLSVGDEELKNISVKIPKSFFYRNDNNKQITLLSDYMFDYWINYKTEKKTDVHYRIIERHIDGTSDTELEILTPATRETAAGSVMASRKASTSPEPLATWTYNIDEKIPLEFAASETNAYMFYGWEVSDSTTVSLSASRSAESTLNINNASDNGVTVTAVVYRRPQVNLDETSPNGLANTVPKDTPVIIKFRHAIAEKEENKILVSYTAEDNSDDTAIRKQYFTTIVNDARDTVTLMPKETNYLKIRDGRTDETVTVTIPYSICYKTADKKTSIYASEEDTVISYRINNTTSKPTIVQFSMDSQNAHVKVDGNSFGTATILTLSNKQVADFQYYLHNKTAGKFNGWNVSVEDSSYTVTPSGFAVSGYIVVEKEGKTYFTLSIDSNDAAHATVTVNDQIGAVGNRSILISTREYEMPLIDTVSPNGEQPEVECDTPVIIRFTKPMDDGSLRKYVSSVEPGTIQIVSASNSAIHYENFFEEQPLSADGKTLRLVPDVSIYTKYASMKIPELRVILDKQNIFDEDGNCLEGNTEWTYTISSETLEKTKVSTSIDNEYANRTSIKINDLEPDAGYEWSVGKAFQIECVPDEELAFSRWEVSGNENGYIELDDYDAISTQVKVTAGIAGNAAQVTVKPVVYLKPVISSYSPKKADGEVPCNTDVSINFNKPMNEAKLVLYNDLTGSGTIQIVSNTNTSRHFEEYFDLTVDESKKSVKLSEKQDKNLREILADERTLDLKVMLDKSIVDEEGYILSGTTEWVYRINDSTKSQTKVTFSIPQAYANDVRINLTGKSSNDLYSVGQQLELECEQLTGKYALEGWKINNGSTSDYISVTPGVGNGKYYLNINKAKGSTTSTNDADVITPVCYLIPKVTVEPQFISEGAEFNRAVEIKFNTALNADTFTVYSDSDTNGSVRIYDPYVPSNHFEEYFSVEYNDGTEPALTITPRTDSTKNVYDLLGDSETKDIKIELVTASIKDTAGHALTGTTVWDYKINRKSVSTTNVSFSITGNNCEVYYINEQGNEQKAVHGTAVQLNLYQTVKIKCVPFAGYGLSVWTSNNSANVSVDGNTKNSAETTITVKRAGVNAVITPTTYLIPVVETAPVELNQGQPYNKAIEIILNQEVKTVDSYSFELYDGSNNGLIRIEDTEYNRCENYFTSSKTTENGKTKITLSPTAEIFNLLGSAQTKAFNISLIPSSKIVEAKNHALTGETTWRYKINRTTVNKTTLNLTQGSTSEDVKKYTLTVNNENYPKAAAPEGYYDYSVNNELEIECTPSVPGYAFKEWIIENYGGSDAGTELTDSEIIIQNKNSSRTKVTIKKALAAEVTITPKLYLIPKATTESIFNKDGEQFNKEITINFNTDLDTSTLTLYDSLTKTGNIQIVSAQNNEDHYEDKFNSTVGFSYNSTSKVGTLTLTPNDSLYKIIGSDGFKELIIIFNKDGIKDSAGNYLGGKNNFNYKINTKSTKKTTVYFALTTSPTTGFDVTVDDGSALAVSNATGYELYSTYKIKCTPKDPANYAFDSWQIVSGGTSYITIADKNAAETTLYVKGYINSSITVTPKVYLIPKITTTAESLLNTAGQPFNKPIEITFSKLMDTSKLTLSNIKVYNGPENIATNTYFYDPSTSTVSGATKVILKPKNALFNILGTDKTRDLVIQFDETKITDNETNKHKLEGTTSFDYRINRNSNTKTNIAFSYSNDSTSGYDVFINNGTSTSASTGASTGYDLYQEIEIECKPKSKEYAFKSWSVTSGTASCVTITDPNSVKTKVKVNAVSSPTPYSLTIKPILYEIPKVTVPPVYNENGCPFDDPITIDFNVEMMQWHYDDCVVEFYDATTNPHGAVQIVDKAGNDISKYFECEFDYPSTKLIITPRDNPILNSANTSFNSDKSVLQWIKGWENVTAVSEMKSLIEAERTRYAVQKREFTIRLIPENLNVLDEIYNAEDFDKLIHLSGTSEWNYCISTQSHYQTNITVQINDADRGNCFVRVGGVEIDANRTYGYNRMEKLELRFISTNEEWIFHHWKITKNYGNYIEKSTSTDPNLFNPSKEDTTLLIKTPKKTTNASITVVPVLQQRPVVLENFTKPDYVVSGVNLDNAIDIVFNKPIRNTDLSYDLTSKIAIKSYKTDGTEENLKNYYTVSPLSNDGLKLTIHPKPGDDLETTLFPPNSQYDKRNVSVIITGIQEREVTGTDAGDDNSSKSNYDSKWEPYNTAPSILTLNSWCTYKYNTSSFTKKIVYNKSRTTDAPALGTVVAYHDKTKNDSDMILPAASNKIDNIPSISGMTIDTINQKYHAKQVYFVCNAYDYGSGVNSFVVTETVRQTRDGMACEIVYPSQEIGTDTIKEEEPYKYVVEFPYNFVAEEDGWVRLDVRARNHVGAVSPQCVTFYFIKDTSMDAEEYFLTNEYQISGSEVPSSYKNKITINPTTAANERAGTSKFSLSDYNNVSLLFVYSSKEQWGIKTNNYCTSPITTSYYYYDSGEDVWLKINAGNKLEVNGLTYEELNTAEAGLSSTSGLLIKAVLKDAVGNEITKTYQMPKKYKVTNYKYSNTGVIATFDNEDTIDSNINSLNFLVGYYPTFASGYVTRSYTRETEVDGVTLYGKMNSSTNAVTLYTSKLYTYKSNTGKEIKLFGDIGEGTACAAPSAALSWVNTGDYNPVVVKTTGTAPAVDYTLTRYTSDTNTGVAKLTFKIDITDFITNILGKNSSTFKDSDVDFALFTGDTDTRSKGSLGELLSDAKFTKTAYGKYTVECKIKTVHYTTESGDKFDYYYRVYVYDKYHASAPKAYSSDAFTIDSHRDTTQPPEKQKFDNTPPVIKDVKIARDLQSIEATVYDVGIGDSSNNTDVWSGGAFNSDLHGRAFVDYWLIPYATSEEYNYLSKLSLETLTDNYPKLSVPFDVSSRENEVYFSLESVYQDKFFVVARLKDKSDNLFFEMIADINFKPFDYTDYVILFKKAGGSKKINNVQTDYGSMELNYYASSIQAKTLGELYNDSQYDYWLVGDYFNEEKGEWAHEYSTVELGAQGNTSCSIVKYFEGENELSGQFQRYYILKTKEDNEINANAYCTNPIYIFTKRSNNLGARNDVYLKNDFVANITYDSACFVETAITPSKFIVTSLEQEKRAWDSKTKKTSPQLFKDDGNAEYSVDLSVANPGDYYRVIVHYDDGSVKMTDIKQVR